MFGEDLFQHERKSNNDISNTINLSRTSDTIICRCLKRRAVGDVCYQTLRCCNENFPGVCLEKASCPLSILFEDYFSNNERKNALVITCYNTYGQLAAALFCKPVSVVWAKSKVSILFLFEIIM